MRTSPGTGEGGTSTPQSRCTCLVPPPAPLTLSGSRQQQNGEEILAARGRPSWASRRFYFKGVFFPVSFLWG